SWELLVLNTLKWDLSAITPFDFLGHILRRLPIFRGMDLVKRHAHTFIGLCTTDVKFSMYPPSTIAAASIGAAIQGLRARLDIQWSSPSELLSKLQAITGIERDCLRACWEQIEETIVSRIAAATRASLNSFGLSTNHKLAEQEMGSLGIIQAETPPDVQDVLF
ncbi:G1/S-specific cyclin-D2, partial [Stegodyphus mimosarum]